MIDALPTGFERLRRITGQAFETVRQFPPVGVATRWVLARLRRKRWPILAPYVNMRSPLRVWTRILFPPVFGVVGLIYGFYFALTAPYLMVPFAVPVLLLFLMSVWALPASRTAPMRTAEFLFISMMISVVVWPQYLAFSAPGLPWITMSRLTGIPMALLLVVSLSTSAQVRRQMKEVLDATDPLWRVMLIFISIGAVAWPLGKSPGNGVERWVIQQVNWTAVALMAAYACRLPGRARRYLILFVLLALPIILVAELELQNQELLWRHTIPDFLKINDPAMAVLLGSSARSATGIYRVKTTFSTPLGLAEYLALLTPFLVHSTIVARSFFVRVISAISIPTLFYYIHLTDSRLGVVGFVISFVVYFVLWTVNRFLADKRDLFSASIAYGTPAILFFFMVASSSVPALHDAIFGGSEHAASDAARNNQLRMGIPSILKNPLGVGAGNSGGAMGYAKGSFVSIDNYYLSIGLDFGVVGLTCFWATFIMAIVMAGRHGTSAAARKDPEIALLIPLSGALSAFLMIKSVFSQQDSHPLLYMMLGMVAALVYRSKKLQASDPSLAATRPAPAPVRAQTRGVRVEG